MSAKFSTNNVLPDSRNPSRTSHQPKGRICESKDCETVLSMYNNKKICEKCKRETPLLKRDSYTAKYL